MKNLKRILGILILINLFIILIHTNIVFATDLKSMESSASKFISAGSTEAQKSDLNKVTDSVTTNFKGLGQILTMVGAGVMVAATAYMGIKYMISPPDKQGALKQQLIGLVAAGIVIFGAYGIWKAILRVVSRF